MVLFVAFFLAVEMYKWKIKHTLFYVPLIDIWCIKLTCTFIQSSNIEMLIHVDRLDIISVRKHEIPIVNWNVCFINVKWIFLFSPKTVTCSFHTRFFLDQGSIADTIQTNTEFTWYTKKNFIEFILLRCFFLKYQKVWNPLDKFLLNVDPWCIKM